MQNDMEYVVHLQNIHKMYLLGKVRVNALQGITLDIPKKKFSVVIGPSGSGKTTLLNIIGCIDKPTFGEVEVCGKNIKILNDNTLTDFRAQNIGFIFQNFNLIPVLSAYENIEYPLLLTNMASTERKDRVMKMLQSVGLEQQKKHRPSELSGGQRQRVAIARALVKEPDVVLADEPTANLDTKTGHEIIALMRSIQEEHNTSFIFSSHDTKVMDRADQVFEIQDGLLLSNTTVA